MAKKPISLDFSDDMLRDAGVSDVDDDVQGLVVEDTSPEAVSLPDPEPVKDQADTVAPHAPRRGRPPGSTKKPPTVIDMARDSKKMTRTSLQVDSDQYREIREWGIRHDISVKNIFLLGFAELVKKHGV